jgi:early secretory antigenic target protein ESAT-6
MANDGIKVTFGGLEAAAGNIKTQANHVEQSLGDLKSFLQPLVASWTGNAAQEYQEHQRKWDQAAADLHQVLAAIGIAVNDAASAYRQGEQANSARWGG